MIYLLHCPVTSEAERNLLEKTIQTAATPCRRMTEALWLLEAERLPQSVEAVLQTLAAKSFVAPLHPNGPQGGNLDPADKTNRKILYVVHSLGLREKEQKKLEELIDEAGPSRKITDSFWLIKSDKMPGKVDAFLQSLKSISFAAPLHPEATCGGNLLAEDAEWIASQASKKLH